MSDKPTRHAKSGVTVLARVHSGPQGVTVETNLEPMAGGRGVWIGGQHRVMSLSTALEAFGADFIASFDGMAREAQKFAKRNSGQVNLSGGAAAVKDQIDRARETMRCLPGPDHRRYLHRAEGSQLGQFQPIEPTGADATASDVTHLDRVWDLVLAWTPANPRDKAVIVAWLSGWNLARIGDDILHCSKPAAQKSLHRAYNHLAWDYIAPALDMPQDVGGR
jgi:predicted RNA-binding protein YlxR (DUF448 family)